MSVQWATVFLCPGKPEMFRSCFARRKSSRHFVRGRRALARLVPFFRHSGAGRSSCFTGSLRCAGDTLTPCLLTDGFSSPIFRSHYFLMYERGDSGPTRPLAAGPSGPLVAAWAGDVRRPDDSRALFPAPLRDRCLIRPELSAPSCAPSGKLHLSIAKNMRDTL